MRAREAVSYSRTLRLAAASDNAGLANFRALHASLSPRVGFNPTNFSNREIVSRVRPPDKILSASFSRADSRKCVSSILRAQVEPFRRLLLHIARRV
jgi:hypothetical protein